MNDEVKVKALAVCLNLAQALSGVACLLRRFQLAFWPIEIKALRSPTKTPSLFLSLNNVQQLLIADDRNIYIGRAGISRAIVDQYGNKLVSEVKALKQARSLGLGSTKSSPS
ncbi:unnamed protein product [Pieris macdunnoughi]|uniref:Uncharacterized protein n=1 Tax=Pieris macdunnoughi TaxID=345717 RepID=A0A821S9I1_9NEOP|nr:unnamed protein product [Pieris macdunnoughi]